MISQESEFRFWNRNFKDTLVLLPGWATDYRIFTNLDLNYNYLLPTAINLGSFKRDLWLALERMSLAKVSLLGWSLGGFLAADFAGQYADRIDTLILLSICKKYEAAVLKNVAKGVKKNKKAYLYKFYLSCFSDTDLEGLNWFKKHLLRVYLEEMHLAELIAGLKFLAKAQIKPESLAQIERIRVFQGSADKIAPLSGAHFMVQESIKHFPIPLRKSLKVIADHAYSGSRQRREGDFLVKSKLSQIEFISLKGLGHIPFLNRQFKEKF